MYLSGLTLENFRNYRKKSFVFDINTTLIVGGNATGKTNILEALYLLAAGGSFRAQRIEEMVYWDAEVAYVSGKLVDEVPRLPGSSDRSRRAGDEMPALDSLADQSNEERGSDNETKLQVILTRGELQGKRVAKRSCSIDGAFKRVSDFVGRLVVILFRPEDLQLILGSPVRRRAFLDEVLLQVNREYRRSLASYEKALSRRNKLLDAIRDGGASRTQLAFWDQLLIKHGQVLTSLRAELIDFINKFEAGIDSFRVFYDSSTISESRLQKYAEQDIALGYTLVGPHKDNFIVQFEDEKELDLYGSRGEQRLAVLWLRLAELAFVSQKIGERPVLLLDDIFSELDQEHRKMVLEVISQQQTIITTTDLHLIEFKYRDKFKIISLE